MAPRHVVTAKHCVGLIAGKAGFALGAIATTTAAGVGPTRVVGVDSFVKETSISDGATKVGYGSDVAVARLAESIDDIEPLAFGAVSPDDVGKTFSVIGYGRRSDGGSGARRSGKVTLKATAGRVLEPLVSFERSHWSAFQPRRISS